MDVKIPPLETYGNSGSWFLWRLDQILDFEARKISHRLVHPKKKQKLDLCAAQVQCLVFLGSGNSNIFLFSPRKLGK